MNVICDRRIGPTGLGGTRSVAMHVKAVIFDWAGTLVDFGSLAPLLSLKRVFEEAGVTVSEDDIRAGMGLGKLDHIMAIGFGARAGQAWAKSHGGQPFEERDAILLHERFREISRQTAAERGKLIGGVLAACRALRDRDILIGTTTGYTRDIMERVIAVARAQGFEAEAVVCADDVPECRPSPLALYHAMVSLGVYPASSVVKVDDTVPGLMEGKAAGAWTVGISETGNEMGLGEDALTALPARERLDLANAAAKRLTDAGADYVIGSVAEIASIVDDINERLADGERPELLEYEPEAA
ncbi:MAG: phosphonoacetaldehyde hydrolase [Ahrensia sp.]|nr:phosphonoacetaldehyde hydrolase [Ahrensia sp.]